MPALGLLAFALLEGCCGTGPSRSLSGILAEAQLPERPPVVLIDLDDTVYEKDAGRPLAGAPAALRELARDHLVVYLTARPTYAKLPWVTHNRCDSVTFLVENGFPDGPLFTSSVWNWLVLGQGGGKVASLRQLRDFGVDRVALAVGDRPHDVEAYLQNGHVTVERVVIVLIEDSAHPDPDREDLSADVLSRRIGGDGPVWPRIRSAYRGGELEAGGVWIVSQPAAAE